MEIVIAGSVALCVWGYWRSRQYKNETRLDYRRWVAFYDGSYSPLNHSRMGTAFIAQALRYGAEIGVFVPDQIAPMRDFLKRQKTTAMLLALRDKALPAVYGVLSEKEVNNTPARAIGMLMLLSWFAPEGKADEQVRQALVRC